MPLTCPTLASLKATSSYSGRRDPFGKKPNSPPVVLAFGSIENFLASSTNPKEFIQRRGRVLRNYEGKTEARIYDIIVLPYTEKYINKTK
jgi:hypothetical protein